MLAAAVCVALLGCPPDEASTTGGTNAPVARSTQSAAPGFVFDTDAGLQSLRVQYDNGMDAGKFSIVESLGGGIGVLDFDSDGRDDLVVPLGGIFADDAAPQPHPSVGVRLLRQVDRDGSNEALAWEDVTEAAGLGSTRHYNHGAACCDYDNDGDRDFLLTGYGGVQLFRNEGDGTFADVTDESGLNADTLWSSTAAWGDLNRDGHADLFVAHYVDWSPENDPVCGTGENRDVCAPKQFQGLPDAIYLSNGDGTFRPSGVDLKAGKGLAAMLADLDADGDLDVIVANDTVANFYYRNDTPRGSEKLTLVEEGLAMGLALDHMAAANGSMGLALTDFNDDGRPDLWVTNFESELFALYRNEGPGGFSHVSSRTGVNQIGTMMVSFGCVAGDLDADGDEDVAVANGHIVHKPVNAPLRQKPVLLAAEDGRFVRTEPAGYFSEPHLGRGLATADFDRDGRLDLVYSHTLEPAELLLNRTPGGQTCTLRLVGTVDAREPAGTAVVATLASGRTLYRQLVGGTSYLSTSAPIVHFGWPDDDPLQSVEVRWPTGEPTRLDASELIPGGDTTGSRAPVRIVQPERANPA